MVRLQSIAPGVSILNKSQASWAKCNVMYTVGKANHKTDMESRDLGDACQRF